MYNNMQKINKKLSITQFERNFIIFIKAFIVFIIYIYTYIYLYIYIYIYIYI